MGRPPRWHCRRAKFSCTWMADLQLLTYSLYSSMSAADCIEAMTATRQPTRNVAILATGGLSVLLGKLIYFIIKVYCAPRVSVLRAPVTDQIEKALFHGSWHFGGDQHFHSTLLFTLDSDLLSCSVLSRITFQPLNYGSCPLSNADGGNHNLTFHNQVRLLWGNFQGS